MSTKVYIRFGHIPKNNKSGVYDGDLGKIREELGVCCYDSIEINNTYRIIMPSICSAGPNDLSSFIEKHSFDNTYPIYLITGDEVGTGTYNEPILNNVKIVSKLKIKEFHNPKPKYKMDRRNPQLIKEN